MALYGHTPAIDYYDISTLLEKCPEDSVMIDKDYFYVTAKLQQL